MRRLFKLLFSIFIFLVVLVTAAVILIPIMVDPNDYKEEISAEVKRSTGRELQMGGEISLSVFPWLGLELNQVRLSNAPGFGDAPMAALDHVKVRAKLMPLLQKHLEVDKIEVRGLELRLARNAKGHTNFDDLLAAGGGQQEGQPTADASEQAGVRPLERLAIGGVELENSRLVWDDQASGEQIELSDLSLDVDAFEPGRPMGMRMGFLLSANQPALKGRFDLSSQLQTDAQLTRFDLLPLDLKLSGLEMAGVQGEFALAGQVHSDLGKRHHEIKGLAFTAKMHGEGLPPEGTALNLLADLVLDTAAQTLDLKGLELHMASVNLSGELHATQIDSAPEMQGQLTLAEFSPRTLLQEIGLPAPETADPAVLNKTGASFQFHSTPEGTRLESLAMVLDDSRLEGEVQLLGPSASAVRFDLSVDAINLDRYLPPAAEPAEGEAAPAPGQEPVAASESEPLFPVETLRGLDLQGVFRIGELVIQNLQARDIELRLESKGGELKLEDRVQGFYEGSLNGSIGLDVRGATPKLKVDQRLAQVQAEPLLKDLTASDAMIAGTARFEADLWASGQHQAALLQSLGGNLEFAFLDGAVKGINLARMVREAKAALKGETLPPENTPNQTDFSELTGSAQLAKGVVVNRDLLGKSPFLRVTGAGEVDLPGQKLDYKLKTAVVSSGKGQGGEGLEDLKGLTIPVHLSGPFSKIDYKVDVKTLLVETQGAKLEGKIDSKLESALGDKVDAQTKDQLKGALKGLFR